MKTEDLVTPSPEMKQHAKDLKNHATEGVQNVRQDVANLGQDAKDHARRNVQGVRDEAVSRLNDVKGQASDVFESAKAYLLENPMRTFFAGVLLGLFIARRRHRS